MTRSIINSPTSSIVLTSFVQALIVVSIVESGIVLLATHIQKERPLGDSEGDTVEIWRYGSKE